MAFKQMTMPSGSTFNVGKATCRLSWSASFPPHINQLFSRKQQIIDSEVLRYCSPMVPLRTGTLERSGTLGTVLGSGEVKYIVPYASHQYYNTAQSRSYDSKRGGKWFERMKTQYKDAILKAAQKG